MLLLYLRELFIVKPMVKSPDFSMTFGYLKITKESSKSHIRKSEI